MDLMGGIMFSDLGYDLGVVVNAMISDILSV